jgi:hypothetical protein
LVTVFVPPAAICPSPRVTPNVEAVFVVCDPVFSVTVVADW